jgi:hypothetical protein
MLQILETIVTISFELILNQKKLSIFVKVYVEGKIVMRFDSYIVMVRVILIQLLMSFLRRIRKFLLVPFVMTLKGN